MGIIFSMLIFLALTPLPFYMHYNLGQDPNDPHDSTDTFIPEKILMMGGAGMPSESNLMRLYYAAEYAKYYQIPVILVHPQDSICHVKMTEFLVNQGIEEDCIFHDTIGTNSRSQVLELRDVYPNLLQEQIFVITSPEHLTRTIKCFNKAGFENVRGISSYEATVDFDLSIKKQKLGGNRFIPDIGNTNIRYTFWNYLKLEITCFREYFAIFYYWLKGWI